MREYDSRGCDAVQAVHVMLQGLPLGVHLLGEDRIEEVHWGVGPCRSRKRTVARYRFPGTP